jgi:uncharacterized membrane protein
MPALPIGDCIKFGWETFKKRPWILIGAIAIAMVFWFIPSLITAPFTAHPPIDPGVPPPPPTQGQLIAGFVGGLIGLAVGTLVSLGLANFFIRAHDNIANAALGDLWNPSPFWRFLGAELLAGIIVFVGMLLLVVPGIIASLGLGFVPYLVVDRNTGPVESLKESWHITKGNKGRLFLLILVLIGLNLVGAVLLLVGLFVTIPVTMLSMVHAYRLLSAQAGPRPA